MAILETTENLRALVIGGSQGIGLGFVQYLLATNPATQVFATYRRPQTATRLLSLAADHPQRLFCIELDVTEENQIIAGMKTIQVTTDRLHFVINCVGCLHQTDLQPEKSLRQINPDHLMRYFQVNSIGALLMAKHLLPLLNHDQPNLFATLSAKIGSIGDNRLGGWYGYRASKAALNMFLKTAAIEYGRKSKQTILVMLHPGTTDTRLSKPFQKGVPPEQLFSVDRTVKQLIDVLAKVTPADSGGFFSWDGRPLPW
jgi:NAD(P)-dependent dehydrogenase (short-subunit alcohol dehydrogenase family)